MRFREKKNKEAFYGAGSMYKNADDRRYGTRI
jgi:hypothetical protein